MREEGIDISSDSADAVDLREARSRRYTDAIRVMLLASGRWALTDMATGKVELCATLSDSELRAAAERQRGEYAEFCRKYADRRERLLQEASAEPKHEAGAPRSAPKVKISLSIEDLFGKAKS